MSDWRLSRVSADRTHHVLHGRPLYAETFDEVLSFHKPGLAAVGRGGLWWHIRSDGRPAHARRFQRAFGYYEGLAAVVDESGWYHVDAGGRAVGTARFLWCGNFTEGRCPARSADGYHHVDPTGRSAYTSRWSYVGDYSHGYAAVQRADGLHTHIDREGTPLHGEWYLDLGVYHKGLAPARDSRGWTHIDTAGQPVYARRFAAVEPFYNGQARVEEADGALLVIDEDGRTVARLREHLSDAFDDLSRQLTGAWRTFAIAAAADLGVFDALPADPETLAASLNAYGPALSRLMRGLGEIGLVERTSDGTWDCTRSGRLLRADHPDCLGPAASHWALTARDSWSRLPSLLTTEDTRPQGLWFAGIARDRAAVEANQRAMSSYARRECAALAVAADWSRHAVIIDAGGGDCTVAVALAARHPEPAYVVLERPEVVEFAVIPAEAASRMTTVGADILQEWPVRGDAVILSRVLHDWEDAEALQILSRARAALPETGRLYIAEGLLGDDSYDGGLLDVHMLCTVAGRERTLGEFERLLSSSGFSLSGVSTLASWTVLMQATVRP